MILTVYERSSLRMQIRRIRRWWRRMRRGRVAPVIGWQGIFAGRWWRWLVINNSRATSGGSAAWRRSTSSTGFLIAIVLPEKIFSLRNAPDNRRARFRAPDIRPFLSISRSRYVYRTEGRHKRDTCYTGEVTWRYTIRGACENLNFTNEGNRLGLSAWFFTSLSFH